MTAEKTSTEAGVIGIRMNTAEAMVRRYRCRQQVLLGYFLPSQPACQRAGDIGQPDHRNGQGPERPRWW
jgi:hypothetical protein